MNQVSNEQKDQVMKTMAIIGFVAVIIFGVWLAVQIVSVMPQTFSSLASIADGVYNYQTGNKELNVSTENSVVNSGETFFVSWDEITSEGTYVISYVCTDGISLDVRLQSGTANIDCDENVSIGGNVSGVELTVESERRRFTDIEYSISFVEEGSTESLAVSNNMITVVNPSIPESDVVATETEEAEEKAEVVEETEVTEPETTPATTVPAPVETIVYETPVSNPNGFVDLSIKIVAVGHLDSNGNFTQRANIDEDARGAFQFEVKNVGTKTSDDWNFVAMLTSGVEYEAPEQSPLQPQERVVFTLGYDNVGESGISSIGATVESAEDINPANDSFTWAVSVVE